MTDRTKALAKLLQEPGRKLDEVSSPYDGEFIEWLFDDWLPRVEEALKAVELDI